MAKVYKRGTVWYSRIRINRKEVRKPLSTNKHIAEDKLGDLIKQRNAGVHGHIPQDMPWAQFRSRYIDHCRGQKQKENTLCGKERAFYSLEKVFPLQRISQFTPETLDETKTKWKVSGMGIYAINRYLRSLKTAAYKAEFWKYIPKQDWRTVSEFKTPKGRLHFFSKPELAALKDVCRGMWRTIFYLGARVGLRPEEIYWLEWRQVDFSRNRIHVEPTVNFVPKDYERRWIPMYPDLRDYLQSLPDQHGHSRVVSEDGRTPTLGSISTYFKRLIKKAALRGSLYTLRHSFASHYVMDGGNIYKLKEYMGHSSIETTQIYVHLVPDAGDATITSSPGI